MTVLHRRLFMFFFIFLFLIIAPVIVLHTQGYRFDISKGIFVYSGSITIKGFPQDFEVYINDKPAEKGMLNVINDSYTINSMRPGKYNLKCTKDGYTAWEKNIEIHSGVSTEFWNVLLFPDENKAAENYIGLNVEQFFLSPRDKKEIVFFSQTENTRDIYLLEATDKKEVVKIFSTEDYNFLNPDDEENVEWSTNNKMLLIPLQGKEGKKEYLVSRIRGGNIEDVTNINEVFNQHLNNKNPENKNESKNYQNNDNDNSQAAKEKIEIEKVRWVFDKTGEFIILTNDKKLYYFYLDNPEKTILLDENVTGFDFAGNRIYYSKAPYNLVWEVKDDKIETRRQISTKTTFEENENFVKLIVYDEYRFIIINDKGELLVFNEEKEKGEKFEEIIQPNVQGIQFSNDGKKLLYWTDNEIWVLMLRKWEVQPVRQRGDKFLITRLSKKINNVQWMDNYENIIFSVDNQIKSSEIDVRDHANSINIYETENYLKNRDVFYNKNNQILYFKDDKNLESFVLIEDTGLLAL